MSSWVVHKFGGTSLANADRYRAARIVRAETEGRPAVVVSAIGGVTDALLDAVARAAAQDDGWSAALHAVRDRNVETARDLLGAAAEPVVDAITSDVRDLEDVLRGVKLSRTASDQTAELISGFGELWSAQLLHAHLRAEGVDARWLDAREVLVVSHIESGPAVQWDTAGERLARWLAAGPDDPRAVVVITGYIASDPNGVPTSLKRNGSDFSASIFGRLLHASSITIWTDVDGVMSADPRRVPEAVLLPHLSYDEAAELAYFGAKVLHPHTMAPAIAGGIPIRIRNARHPERAGSVLTRRDARATGAPVKGFSSSDDVALLNLEGVGLVGVPGIAQRLFGALREVGVSVMMISQAGSEHSICAAIPAAQAGAARTAVERAFHAELHDGLVQTVDVDGPYCILAAVGDDMAETPGVSARFFAALGAADINVRAIAQGSSERNISVVVRQRDAARALRAVHAGFYLSDQTLSVGLLGPGRIGRELLAQIRAERDTLHDRFQIDLRVRGIARSGTMVLDELGLDLGAWEQALTGGGEPADLERFTTHVHAEHLPHAVIVDCTASGALNPWYPRWLERGIHVVTANKHATSSALELYQRIRAPLASRAAHYFGSATVGAGLPIINTLRDLIRAGDRVLRIEGVLSGTLSYVFNRLGPDCTLSAIVADAHERGYTEPDPREDLSGMDVVRKALILGREMGLPLEPGDVTVESLVPDALRDGDADAAAFIAALAAYDDDMERRRAEAAGDGGVLRYVAVVDADGATVGPRAYDGAHAFARIRGADNIIAFTTERYREQPLIVQGPGAGPAVTAGGVFADLLRLAAYVGAPS